MEGKGGGGRKERGIFASLLLHTHTLIHTPSHPHTYTLTPSHIQPHILTHIPSHPHTYNLTCILAFSSIRMKVYFAVFSLL